MILLIISISFLISCEWDGIVGRAQTLEKDPSGFVLPLWLTDYGN